MSVFGPPVQRLSKHMSKGIIKRCPRFLRRSRRPLRLESLEDRTLPSTVLSITDTLNPGQAAKIYEINATQGELLQFHNVSVSSNQANWDLYGTANQFLNGGNINTDFTQLLPNAGKYELVVAGNGISSTVTYSFQVNDISEAPVAASGFGVEHSGAITAGSHQDFAYTASAGQVVYYNTLLQNFDPLTARLIDPTSNNVFFISTSSNAGPLFLPHSGNYTLRIEGSNSSSTGSFDFNLLALPANAAALTLGTAATGTLSSTTQVAAFSFSGSIGQRLMFNGRDQSFVANAFIYSPSLQNIININTSSDSNPFALAESGTYFVLVSAFTPTSFHFNILDVAAAPAVPLTTPSTPVNKTQTDGLETDLYTISGAAGQRLFFQNLSNSSTNADWDLFDPANAFVNSANISNPFEATLASAGTYVLEVRNFGASPLTYSFQVNTEQITTTPLSLDTATAATIANAGDQQVYTFTGTIGQRLVYNALENTTSGLDAELVSPSGHVLLNTNSVSSSNPFTLSEAGTYRLIISAEGQATTGTVNFQLIDAGAAPAAPITSPPTPVGPTTQANPFQYDAYTISGNVGDRLFFQNLTFSSFSASWLLFDPDNAAVTAANISSPMELTLSSTGTYILLVQNFSSSPLTYSFQVNQEVITTTPLSLNTATSGTIAKAGDQQVYTFTGTIGQRLVYNALENTSSGIDAELVSPTGQLLFNTNSVSSTNPLTLIEAGTYRLIISAEGQTGTGNFSFQMIDAGAAPAVPITHPPTPVGPITQANPFQYDAYIISGNAGDRLFFQNLTFSSTNASWILFDPANGGVVATNISAPMEATLASSGPYILLVQNFNNSPLTYSFQVNKESIQTTPISYGSTVTGSIGSAGDQQRYTFTGTAGQVLVYDALENTSTTLNAEIFTPSGHVLTNTNSTNDSGPFALTENGTYQVIVSGQGQAGTGAFSFRILNAAAGTAVPLTHPPTPVSKIQTAGFQVDAYTISGNPGDRLFFQNLSTSSTNGSWELYDPAAAAVAGTNISANFEASLASPGTYVLLVFSSDSNPLTYSFAVNKEIITTTPLVLNTATTGTIVNPGDQQIYTFTVTAGQRLVYDALENSSTGFDAELFSPSGHAIFNNNSISDSNVLTFGEPGQYRLVISGEGQATTGSFKFQVIDAGAAAAITLGNQVNKTQTSAFEDDAFTITTAAAGKKLNFHNVSTTSTNATWQLLDTANTVIASGSAINTDFQASLPNAGIYILEVVSNNSSAITYSFLVTDISDSTQAATGFGVEHSGTITAGATQTFTYKASAGQIVFFNSLLQNGAPLTVTLTSPLAGTLFTISTSSNAGPLFLPRTDTYTLTIQGSTPSSTGDFDFNFLAIPANTTALTLGAVTSATVSNFTATVYTFTGSAGQRVVFNGLDTSTSVSVSLLSPSLHGFGLGNTSTFGMPFFLSENGTYYVFAISTQSSPFTYHFRLIDAGASPAVPITSPPTPQNITQTSAQQEDAFTISGNAGDRLFFQNLSASSTNADWFVYDPANSQVAGNNISGPMEVTLATTGTYVLFVQNFNGSPITYSFQVRKEVTTTTALTLGAATSGTIDAAGDSQIYTFTGTVGQRLIFDSLNNTFTGILAELFSPSGHVLFNTFSSNSTNPFTLSEAGTYQLIVSGQGQAVTGGFSFELLDLLSGPAVPITAPPTPVNKTQTSPFEFDAYTFSGNVGDRLFFANISASSTNASWFLFDPANSQVAGANITGPMEVSLTSTGTYVLLVESFNNGPITYSFQARKEVITTTPLTLGSATSGTIAAGGDQQIYTFAGSAGQRLFYNALDNTFTGLLAELFSPSGHVIFNTFANNTTNVSSLIEPGTYRLIISAQGGIGTGNFKFQVVDVGVAPPVPITNPPTPVGPITQANPFQYDAYTVTGNAGDQLFFQTLSTSGTSASWILLNPTNSQIAGANIASTFTVTLPSTGTFVLLVENFVSTPLTYTFQVRPAQSPISPITIGETVNGNIAGGDQDIYTFTGNIGQRLIYDPLENSSNDLFAELVDPSGHVVFNVNSVSDTNPVTLTLAGTYELIISAQGGPGTGPFSFRLLDASAGSPVPITLPPTPVIVNQPAGFMTDAYTVSANAGDRLFFQSLSVSSTNASWLLFDPANSQVAGANISGNFEATLTTAGTYILLVQNFGSNPLSYSFQVNKEAAPSTPLTFGATTNGTIANAGDLHIYTFTGTIGQRLYFDALENTSSGLDAELFDQNGHPIFNIDSTSDQGPFTITEAGPYRLIVSAEGGATTGNFSFRLLDASAVATKLAFGQEPTNTATGQPISPAVTVLVEDQFGNVMTSDNTDQITMAIGINPGGSTLSGTLTVAVHGGIATFSDLSLNNQGKGYTLVASAAGLTGATSNTFDVVQGLGPPTHLVFGQQPTNSTAGQSISPAVTVFVEDASNSIVVTDQTDQVTIAIGTNPGGGTLSGMLTLTVHNGVATFSDLSINKAGIGYTLTAATPGLTGDTSGSFDITAGQADHLLFVQQPSDAATGQVIAPAVTVKIVDQFGNLVDSSADVSMMIGNNPGGGTLSGTTPRAASGGIATFDDLSIDKSGQGYTLFASSMGLIGIGSASFNVSGVATHFAVSAPAGAGIGTAFSFTVTALDDSDHVAFGYSGTVQFTSSDGAASLPGDSTLTNGTGTFSATLNTPGSQTITATDSVNASITGTSNTIVVNAPATHFAVSAPASATAGNAFTFTVTALDANDGTATGYSGTVHFTSTDGNATVPGDVTLTNGVGTFSATLRTAGSQTITATDTVNSSITGTSNTIDVSAAAATHFAVSAPSNATAGNAFNFTVTAQDQFNNTDTGYTGTVHFTSSDGNSTLPADSTLSNGTGTFSATLKTAGSQTITATDTVNSSINGSSNSIDVIAAAATHFAVSAPSSATAGTAFNFTVTALDQFDNTDTNYTGTVHFTSSDGNPTLPANSTLSNGTGTFSATLRTAGNQTITDTDTANSSITGTSDTISVSAAAATHFAVSAPASATAGTAFSFTVTALDQFNNTDTGYGGTVHFISSDGQAVLPGNSTLTNGTGTFSATLKTAGSQTITVTDTAHSSISGTSNTIDVSALAATHFAVSAPSSATAGSAFNFTVTAQDQFNNTDTGYTGTVHFTSSDGNSTLPADSTLSNGTGTFSATLKTAGNQTVAATDTANASITGTSNVIAVSGAAATHFTVSAPSSATAGNAFSFTVTALDQFNNTDTHYVGIVHFTSTDGNATVPANTTLTNGTGTFSATLRTAGSQTITGTDTANSSITGTSDTISVSAAAATHFAVSAPATATAGTAFSFTVMALDQFNNTDTGYGGMVHFTSSDGQAVLPGNSTLTNGTGTFSATLKTAGLQTITATDTANSSIAGTSNSIDVGTAAATHFAVGTPSSAAADSAFNVTVTAQDQFNNTATSYGGTVHFTSTDGAGVLPADTTLANGTGTFSATLHTSGTQHITATDTVNSSITGTSNAINVTAGITFMATGSGVGAPPLVKVFDPTTNDLKAQFLAFDPAFLGGVRVAVGDVNGDGVADIIVAAGAGGGPHVKVVDGTKLNMVDSNGEIDNAALLGQFYAYSPFFNGGVSVAFGVSDGLPEIITGAGPGGSPHVKVIDGTKINMLQDNAVISDSAVVGQFYAYSPFFNGGVSVAAADVNGDQILDIITGAGPGGGPHVKVIDGNRLNQLDNDAEILNSALIGQFYAYDPGFTGGVSVAAADLNGDGRGDIVAGTLTGSSHVKVVNGSMLSNLDSNSEPVAAALLADFFAYNQDFAGGVNVGTLSRDLHGKPSVITGPGLGFSPLLKSYDLAAQAVIDSFFAYENDPLFQGGVYVGGS
jgi:hypothetical protein